MFLIYINKYILWYICMVHTNKKPRYLDNLKNFVYINCKLYSGIQCYVIQA